MGKKKRESITKQKDISVFFADKLPEIENEIKSRVYDIREHVTAVDPIKLLCFLTNCNYMAIVGKTSESQNSPEEDMQLRSVEYVQSVLISSESKYQKNPVSDDQSYADILEEVKELYMSMFQYFLSWSCNEKDLPPEEIEYIVYTQMMSQVRGTQYQQFRIPMIEELIRPHEDEIMSAYGISCSEIISGLTKMEYNLSKGWLEYLLNGIDLDGIRAGDYSSYQDVFYDTSLYDVKKNTNWPDSLIKDLSYEIGEDKSFFEDDKYAGWPLLNLPVAKKPFIRVDDTSYCFDYYILFDYFYRNLQKIIVAKTKGGVDTWNRIQAKASEEIVASVFNSLLPGCVTHISNHYPIIKKGKKENAENDIIVQYEDVLLIVEVKAGAFTYTPAITDFSAHKKSLNKIVEVAENQCLRTKEYIESSSKVAFYKADDLKEISFELDMSEYSQVYLFDVTLADMNDRASQMERIGVADAKEDIIVLSMNDLWVYKEYFDSSLDFIHFLSQRVLATRSKRLVVCDELDHLGLYIEHNNYSQYVELLDGTGSVYPQQYREDIDVYLSKINMGEEATKPRQNCPIEIRKILEIILSKKIGRKTLFSNFLLDMAGNERSRFVDSVYKLAKREKELGKMIPSIGSGENSYVMTVNIPDIENWSLSEQKEYTLANMVKYQKPFFYRMEIVMDGKNEIKDVNFDYLTIKDISPEKMDLYREKGEEYAKTRVSLALSKANKNKIYPNEPCPCGSGKKYKKCCGR
ncbi:SEC-C motif-containing protein [Lachnospiraceae bacterium YSD2013]|nr:SEC-C motif-containing protein [Lachnospiraceae bacterium YSD2013]